jgi:proteic killer suppression protein
MRVEFATTRLEKALSDEREMTRRYGQLAKPIKNRLSVLRVARSLADVPKVPPERCHQLGENRDEQFAVDLKHPHRLVFEVADDPIPRLADGGIDLSAVAAIRVIEIVDYH